MNIAEAKQSQPGHAVGFTGTITQSFPLSQGQSASGKNWSKLSFLVKDDSDQILVSWWSPTNKNAELVGSTVAVSGKLEEYQGKLNVSARGGDVRFQPPETQPALDPWEGTPADPRVAPATAARPSKPTEKEFLEMHQRLFHSINKQIGMESPEAWDYAKSIVATGLIAWGQGNIVMSDSEQPDDGAIPF